MAAVPLLLLLSSSSLLPVATGMGTIAYFYNVANGPSKAGVVASKVTADPGAGSPLGCTQLPLAPLSAKFNWNDTSGIWRCSYVVFYQDAVCTPGTNDSWIRASDTDNSTTFNNFTAPSNSSRVFNLPGITTAKSLRCATYRDQDPCHVLGCSDPGAQCYSLPNVNLVDPVFQNTSNSKDTMFYSYKNCSTCLQAYVKNTTTGACIAKCSLHPPCPANSTCEKTTGNCTCPDDFYFNSTSWSCVDITAKIWLGLLNPFRKAAGIVDLRWDASLAATALANVKQVERNCSYDKPNLPPRIPANGTRLFSENDAWQPNSLDENEFVKAWTPGNEYGVPASAKTNKRIISASTTAVGCGKAYCGVGSLVTCLFSPYTF